MCNVAAGVHTHSVQRHVTFIYDWRMANANGKLNGRARNLRRRCNVCDDTHRVLLTYVYMCRRSPMFIRSFVRFFFFFCANDDAYVCGIRVYIYYYYYDSMQFYIITLNSIHSVRCFRVASDSFVFFFSFFFCLHFFISFSFRIYLLM